MASSSPRGSWMSHGSILLFRGSRREEKGNWSLRRMARTGYPSRTSSRRIYAPRKPVPPVTSTFACWMRIELVIPVISFSRLSAQFAFRHFLFAGSARVSVVQVCPWLRKPIAYGIVDIVADQVHQPERAHLETGCFHQPSMVSISRSLLPPAAALQIIRSCYVVDDKAGRIACKVPAFYPCCAPDCMMVSIVVAAVCCVRDDFHQLHQRGGVEEMHARQSVRDGGSFPPAR